MSLYHDQDGQNSQNMSLMAYDQYSRWVRWTPYVPHEEIVSLLHCVLRGREEHAKWCPDRQVLHEAQVAREHLVLGLQRLVIHHARRFSWRFQSMELLDLIQEGNLGLLYAIDRFPSVSVGNGFIGYASVCIRQALWRAYLERDGMMVIPEGVGHLLNQVRRAEQRFVCAQGEEPSFSDIAAEVGMCEQELVGVLSTYEQRHCFESLHNPFNEDDAEDIHERVNVFASWVGNDEEQSTPFRQRVREAVEALEPREREVLTLRYGLEGHVLTCLELAERMGTTERAIEGVGYRARTRLRKMLTASDGGDLEEVSA